MTNTELAAYLSRELHLSGPAAVTANVIRQWVAWDVLPRAEGRGRGRGHGVEWERGERDLRRARRLAEWRAAGVKREAAVIVHAFVQWGHPDWERVRGALASELKRAAAALRRRISTDLRFEAFSNVSATRKRAFRTQLGPLDSRLKATQFELLPELYALSGQAMFNGETDRETYTRLISEKLGQIAPGYAEQLQPMVTVLFDAEEGLFADSEETLNVGTTMIERCSKDDLRSARLLFNASRRTNSGSVGLAAIAAINAELVAILSKIEPEIQTGYWLVGRLAMTLSAVMRCQQRPPLDHS